jgi:H+/Cl- antiporter ClcA
MTLSRRSRHLLFSRPLWNRRIWFVSGALAVGLVAIGFAIAANFANLAFAWLLRRYPLAPLIVTPLGFALIVFITRRFFPGAQGSGIPQTIAALSAADPVRRALLSLRIALGKLVLTIMGLLSGASIGREGPTVQIGAALMFRLSKSRLFPYEGMQRGLILAGAAAGVAGAFNAPLAGVVFAIEEMSRSFEQRTVSIVVTAVIVAGVLSLALQGDYAYFGHSHATIALRQGVEAVLLCGVVGGFAGGVFSRVLLYIAAGLPGRVGRLQRLHPIAFAAAAGLALAVLGLMTAGRAFGTGYEEARSVLEGATTSPWFGLTKALATIISYASGIPGGIFAPSLAAGAGLGQMLGNLLPLAPGAAIALLGMVGYFSGVVQAPLTAFIIVTEMTRESDMALPLMSCSLLAYGVSRMVCPHPLYKALATPFRQPRNTEKASG